MAKKGGQKSREIDQYDHKGQTRLNNPPVGLVTPETDKLNGKTRYGYDPNINPQLQWAGKAEHSSFDVAKVSLHVHERMDPATLIAALKQNTSTGRQTSLFEFGGENLPLREAIEFYKHQHNWSNRLIAGDSLLVMNSLLEKEAMAGKVQMVFFDPPYGITYGSNFQPFVNRREAKDGKDEDLTQEPEMVKAFRDTWELGIHSYLTYLRDRLLLVRQLLAPTGSVFVQISDENVHHVREILDEVFGASCFKSIIIFRKTTGKGSKYLDSTFDLLLWYGRSPEGTKYRPVFVPRGPEEDYNLRWVEFPDGRRERIADENRLKELLAKSCRLFRPNPLTSQTPSESTSFTYRFEGKDFSPGKGGWKTNQDGMDRLREAGRLIAVGNTLCFVRYLDDFPFKSINNIWDDTRQSGFGESKVYVVQTSPRVVERCILMTTDPGDLVMDPTCGSGTTAFAAEKWGRRWVTCDTSRVALTIAKQRLVTSSFEYYKLAHPDEGVSSGFVLERVAHVTLKSIARGERASSETLYDRPAIDSARVRVSGPFTVEAVPALTVRAIYGPVEPAPRDSSVARTGETLRQAEWRDELLKTGLKGKAGQKIEFSRVEALPAHRWLHAEAATTSAASERVVVSFGPEHAPLDPRQVALALEEAQRMVPKPRLIVFAAFQFDPEAARDIDETDWPGVTLLKAQMNPDLLTEDLKKKRASNESFWLIGQPDAIVRKVTEGKDRGKWVVEVRGFDYYNTKTGTVESAGTERIALWMVDTDFDGRSLFPRQVFLPLAGDKEGWSRLARSLRNEIDEDAAEAYRGTVSLPFDLGVNKRVAVKIVDDRGIESLKVFEVD